MRRAIKAQRGQDLYRLPREVGQWSSVPSLVPLVFLSQVFGSVACLSINASTAVRSRGSPPLIRDGIHDERVAQGGKICKAITY